MSKRKRSEERTSQANWQLRQLAGGNCPRCGEKLDLNRRRGQPYKLCRGCRAKKATTQQRLMRRRRRRGLAPVWGVYLNR